MNEQTVVDRITETENLTDGLEDNEANLLIDWGIQHAKKVVGGIKDDDAAGDKLNDVMAVMRQVNQIVSNRTVKSADALAQDISALTQLYTKTFGHPAKTEAADSQKTAAAIAKQSPEEAVKALTELVTPPETTSKAASKAEKN